MDIELRDALLRGETDVDGALYRLSGDEELYCHCLALFLEDQSVFELDRAIKLEAWDDAFTAAHALKGVAGNMGFIPLFQAAAAIVVLIRAGRTHEVEESYTEVKKCYDKIAAIIRRHCGTSVTD